MAGTNSEGLCGAVTASLSSEEKERDQSRVDGLILKDELRVCLRSKRSLSQRLCEAETNMLAIISKYQEELDLATAHEHKVADEYARVYADGPVCSYIEWESRASLIVGKGQSYGRHLLRPRGDPRAPPLLSAHDRPNGLYN